jgi:hypothetical protein
MVGLMEPIVWSPDAAVSRSSLWNRLKSLIDRTDQNAIDDRIGISPTFNSSGHVFIRFFFGRLSIFREWFACWL